MNFEKIFKMSTIAMRVNRCHPGIVRDKLWIVQFVMISILNASCFALLSYSIAFHDIRNGKFVDASKNAVMVIVSVTISFKYIILLRHQNSINEIIYMINDDYELAETFLNQEKIVIKEYMEKGVTACKVWLFMALCSTIIFPLKAFVIMGYLYWKGEFKLVPMFDFTYPAIIEPYKNIMAVYLGLFALHILFSCYASSMYTGFDPLVPIIMLHCCGQIEVISQRIINIFSETSNEQQIEENLKKIVLKLQVIYRVVDTVKANFVVLYEFTMKTTTFLMPLSAFQVFENLRNRDTNVEFIPFFIGTIVHFYMPCYYSDLLMEKSERLRQAIYSSGWEQRGTPRARPLLLFMLTRATRPLVIHTVFYPICLDTFAEMCRTSYAIFNIMTAAWT